MKLITGIFSGVLALAVVGCDNVSTNEATDGDDNVRVEKEVVGIDTTDVDTKYEVARKEVEMVDTVGAVKEYEVEKKVVEKTVEVDEYTEETEGQTRVKVDDDGYEVVDEDVETETVEVEGDQVDSE